jgi:hypothetical protein
MTEAEVNEEIPSNSPNGSDAPSPVTTPSPPPENRLPLPNYGMQRSETINTVVPGSGGLSPLSLVRQSSSLSHVREEPEDLIKTAVESPIASSSSAKSSKMSSSKKGLNSAVDINSRLDTQVEVRVYPCNNASTSSKKKFTQFMVKPEGVIIQGTSRTRTAANDLGTEYAQYIGRKLQRYELSDTRACQLLVTSHNKSYYVVPAPEAFSRHSGTCRLLGDRKHPVASHTLKVGDFLRVGSVGVVVIETHNGEENQVLSEEKIQKIMKDTTNNHSGFLDIGDTDGGKSFQSDKYFRCLYILSLELILHNLQKTQKTVVKFTTNRLQVTKNPSATCALTMKTQKIIL